jgi:hypothetical protein
MDIRKYFIPALSLLIATGLTAQTPTDSVPAKPEKRDTIRIGSIIIIKKSNGKYESDGSTIEKTHKHIKRSIGTINWWIVDLGFANFTDRTNYTQAVTQDFLTNGMNEQNFQLKPVQSINVNIWIFMQRLKLVKNAVNLKYGLGVELNNYRFDDTRIRFNKSTSPLVELTNKPELSKNKLAADYITVPLMLNINFTPKKDRNKSFGVSGGISAGYLYSSRQKIKGGGDGIRKTKDDFALEPFKISYISEVQLGPVRLYGSLATKNMFSKGLDMTPYNFGIRLTNW